MTTERAQELQTAITKEALALMVIHGDYVCTAAEADDIHVSHFEKVIKLIGEAWGLPEEVPTANLSKLDQERRSSLLNLAQELAECQNILDWIEKSPAEKELPEIAVS